jgi:hypothetical protein
MSIEIDGSDAHVVDDIVGGFGGRVTTGGGDL